MEFICVKFKGLWSLKNKGYSYVLVVIDKFSTFGWKIPLKFENAQTIKVTFQNSVITSKRKMNLIEKDDRKRIVSKIFTDLLKKNNKKRYSRYTSLAAVLEELVLCTIRVLLEKPVFNLEMIVGWKYYLQ